MKSGKIRRSEIFLANLGDMTGSEQGGIRPVLIIQNDIGNEYSDTTIIAPITSNIRKKEYPTNVFISKKESCLPKDSTILTNQIRTIDKRRIIRKISQIDNHLMSKVNAAIKVSLGLDDLSEKKL